MRYLSAHVIVFLSLILVSCASLTREDTNRWLDSKEGEPGLDMTGKWDSGGIATGGWGEGNFIQDGKNFSGKIVESGAYIYQVEIGARVVNGIVAIAK